MSALFSPGTMGSLELSNRIVRTASHEGLADARGRPTQAQADFYRGFVDGGVGLVVTGYAGITRAGRSALHHMTMIDGDELIPAHRALVDRVHEAGGPIVLQIAHCGRQTWSTETGLPLMAPSPIPCGFYGETPEEMTAEQIGGVVEAFGAAARRAAEAGYDGVQIHAAHGYLLSSFLSRHTNHREDEWGGSAGNRFRLVGDVLRGVRRAVGPGFPVLIKLNTFERHPDGVRAADCVRTAGMVEETGCCDAIELSCGTTEGGFVMARGGVPADAILDYLRPYCHLHVNVKKMVRYLALPVVKLTAPRFAEGYNLEAARAVKERVSLPIITVGGMRTRAFMESAIADGATDFCSMARPLILEPDLPERLKSGASQGALCDNCNACVVATDTQRIRCHNTTLIHRRAGEGLAARDPGGT